MSEFLDLEFLTSTAPDISEPVKTTSKSSSPLPVPMKSKPRYMLVYETFTNWMKEKSLKSFSENVFLAYFYEITEKYKPTTVWSIYCMLKSTVNLNHNINIAKYTKLLTFLRRNSDSFKRKTSRNFTVEQLQRFLSEAPDHQYLVTKVATIFAICGAIEDDKLIQITADDVETHNQLLLVNIPNTKNRRSFTIRPPLLEIVKQYQTLRPKTTTTKRFFLNFQPQDTGMVLEGGIGENKLARMPQKIAKFLELSNPELYTFQSIRRSSSSFLANSSTNQLTPKNPGNVCKSDKMVEEHKKQIGEKIRQIAKQMKWKSSVSVVRREEGKSTFCGTPPVHHEIIPEPEIPAIIEASTDEIDIDYIKLEDIKTEEPEFITVQQEVSMQELIPQPHIDYINIHDIKAEEEVPLIFPETSSIHQENIPQPEIPVLDIEYIDLKNIKTEDTDLSSNLDPEKNPISESEGTCEFSDSNNVGKIYIRKEAETDSCSEDVDIPQQTPNIPSGQIKKQPPTILEQHEHNFNIVWNTPNLIEFPNISWAVHRNKSTLNQRSIIISNIILPSSRDTTVDYINFPETDTPYIERQIVFSEMLGLRFQIDNVSLSNYPWNWNQHLVTSFTNLNRVIKEFSIVQICKGGPKVSSYPQQIIQTSVARVDKSTERWRHNNCTKLTHIKINACYDCQSLFTHACFNILNYNVRQ